MNALLVRCNSLYALWTKLLGHLQHVFLFAIRAYWGWQFMLTGWGKFNNWERTVGFFTSLGIPAPQINVGMAASTEALGGLCLLLGLGGRVITVPLIFTMVVAYATADRDALLGIVSDPDTFFAAAPFLFLYAAVIVLLFGPGRYSLDTILAGRLGEKGGAK